MDKCNIRGKVTLLWITSIAISMISQRPEGLSHSSFLLLGKWMSPKPEKQYLLSNSILMHLWKSKHACNCRSILFVHVFRGCHVSKHPVISPRWLGLIQEVKSDNSPEISRSCCWNIWLPVSGVDTLNNQTRKVGRRVDNWGGTKGTPAASCVTESARLLRNSWLSSSPCCPSVWPCWRPSSVWFRRFLSGKPNHQHQRSIFRVKKSSFFFQCPQGWRWGGEVPVSRQTRGRPVDEPCRRPPGGQPQVGESHLCSDTEQLQFSLNRFKSTHHLCDVKIAFKKGSGEWKVIRRGFVWWWGVSGSCCLLVWSAGGSWETWSSPTGTRSSCVPEPSTAPSVPSCSACRASRRGGSPSTIYTIVSLEEHEVRFCWIISRPQRGGGQHREGEPAAETVHVSVRLAEQPVRDAPKTLTHTETANMLLPSSTTLKLNHVLGWPPGHQSFSFFFFFLTD